MCLALLKVADELDCLGNCTAQWVYVQLRWKKTKKRTKRNAYFEHYWDHRPPDMSLLKWGSEQMHLGSVESLRFDNTFTFLTDVCVCIYTYVYTWFFFFFFFFLFFSMNGFETWRNPSCNTHKLICDSFSLPKVNPVSSVVCRGTFDSTFWTCFFVAREKKKGEKKSEGLDESHRWRSVQVPSGNKRTQVYLYSIITSWEI